jgi:hypothetical protein
MRTRLCTVLLAASAALAVLLGSATPAQAATLSERISVATAWSQSTASSQTAWNSARLNPAPWASYTFDWSTDYCSSSPDQPLGFDFRLPCQRHDFGYRNFKRLNVFPANKSRIDDAFYYDMKQVCARYTARTTCLSTAWTYYQAVKRFGSLVVEQSELRAIEANRAAA